MRISVFFRVFFGYLFIILTLSGVNLLVFSDASRDIYRETVSQNLENAAFFLKTDVVRSLDKGAPRVLDSLIKEHGKESRMRITVIDRKGIVLADSDENPRLMENHKNRPEVVEALDGRMGRSARFSSTTNKDAMYVAVPLEGDGQILGVLRVGVVMHDVVLPSSVTRRMVIVCAVLAFLALLGAFVVSRNIWQPIKDLAAASKQLATGDFSARVFLKRNDEFKLLADTFNAMGREIQAAFEELGKQKAELKSIIDSLREALVVIDEKGVIVYCNQSLKTMIGRQPVMEGELYWEVLGEAGFVGLVEKARSNRLSPLEEVSIQGKVFLCSSAHVNHSGEIAIVLHDITSMKEIERIKRDLVTNVSHELRTPLTSIKGFAETLEEEVGDNHKHYVEVIRRNTDRLINIVRDLLLLSQLEEKGTDLELESVDIRKLAEDTIRVFDQQLKEKGLALKFESADDLPHLQADPFKIEQVLINLLDNAIKYTDSGEVRVSLIRQERRLVMEVHDTGVGIPKDSLPFIFERFYVVDKSRSRKAGGTGLGLSIVKHIVLLHGGEISVESEAGKGSTFVVRLPLSD